MVFGVVKEFTPLILAAAAASSIGSPEPPAMLLSRAVEVTEIAGTFPDSLLATMVTWSPICHVP